MHTTQTNFRNRVRRAALKAAAGTSILLCTLGAWSPAQASSLGVEPLYLELRPSGSATVRVSNNADGQMPVEVFIWRRDVDEAGNQTRTPADDDFIVFPPQAVVGARSTQAFRLQAVTPKAAESASYYVSFSQVPQDMLPDADVATQIQVVFAFDAAVHVVPPRAKPDLSLDSQSLARMRMEVPTGEFEALPTGQQRPISRMADVAAVDLTVSNSGNRFAYLHQQNIRAKITDTSGKTSDYIWSEDDIANAIKVTLLEPNETRRMRLPLPEGLEPAKVEIRMSSGS